MTDAPRGPIDTDQTGVLSIQPPRLADFLDDDDDLPLGYLLAVAGPDKGTGLLIRVLPSVIGRAGDAELRLADETVSRHHLRLIGDRDGVAVADLGSANGTMLNGNRIVGELHLRDGDLLELGASVLLVKLFT